ncbi:MAG TPA: VOC family protein [Gemmatimonadaceae bacterium]|nr:VOC family protein [Gemmatimonadaceae bacterium]
MSMTDYGIQPPNYRLPNETHLGRVRLQVSDLARSQLYYEHVLGLRILEKGSGFAVLGAQREGGGEGEDKALVELRELAGARPAPRRGRIGLYHFAILLPDRPSLGRFLAHLEELGAYAGMSDHFVSEAIYLTDPDGLGIEVYADRPRSTWKNQDGQLVMTTVPLDVENLVAAAKASKEGTSWRGMPPGTVIGHVHLHVGDLERAAAFYHAGLGLDKTVWNYPGALFLSAGGYHHHLGTNTWAAGAPPAGADDARLLEWEVVVPTVSDAADAAQSLTSASGAVRSEGTDWLAADPWGTVVRIRAEDGSTS